MEPVSRPVVGGQQSDGSWLLNGVRYWVLDGGPDPADHYRDVPEPEPPTRRPLDPRPD